MLRAGDLLPAKIKKETKAQRDKIYWHFADNWWRARVARHTNPAVSNDPDARVMGSSVFAADDLIIDMDVANCEVTDNRHLDRYYLEHIFTLPETMNVLLLVRVADDVNLFIEIAQVVDINQKLDRKTISGKEYYQLRCNISDAKDNALVTGGLASKIYT